MAGMPNRLSDQGPYTMSLDWCNSRQTNTLFSLDPPLRFYRSSEHTGRLCLPGFCGGQLQSEDSQRLGSCSSTKWHAHYRVVGGFAGDVQYPTLSAAPSSLS